MLESGIRTTLIPITKHPLGRLLVRMFKEKPLARVGFLIVVMWLAIALSSSVIAREGINELPEDASNSLKAPSAEFWFGTDALGRDQYSRIVKGAVVSVIVGLCATAIGVGGAVIVGTLSGYIGGKVDIAAQRLVDGLMAFPFLLFALMVVGIFQDVWRGPEGGMFKVIVVLGILFTIWLSRVVRGAVLATKELQYVEAAKAVGCSDFRIMMFYILPNIMPTIIILATLSVAWAVLLEAALSFLGFGVPPPFPSWGGMLGDSLNKMRQAPWLVIFPGFAISLFVFGVQVFGDGLRDLLDPRLGNTRSSR